MSFRALLAATRGILLNVSSGSHAKTIPDQHVKTLAFDLCLVAGGIRAGFLLDGFTPFNPPELFFSLLQTLRQTLPEFRRVIHLHDENSNQTFFVNTALIHKSREDVCILGNEKAERGMRLNSDGWVDCVSLEILPVIITPQPQLRTIWDHIIGSITSNPSNLVVQIPSDLTTGREHLLIPLAAFLLEYPVGYVPLDANQTTFLSSIPLDVYECVLEGSGEEHPLLKFSCPQCVSQSVARLAPDEVRMRLVDRFQPRLQAVDYPGQLKLSFIFSYIASYPGHTNLQVGICHFIHGITLNLTLHENCLFDVDAIDNTSAKELSNVALGRIVSLTPNAPLAFL